MINTLEDLNNKVMLIVNRMINRGCQETTTGNYIFSYNDVSEFISYEDYLLYQHFIYEEILSREEVADVDYCDESYDICFWLDWCVNYEPWQEEIDEVN